MYAFTIRTPPYACAQFTKIPFFLLFYVNSGRFSEQYKKDEKNPILIFMRVKKAAVVHAAAAQGVGKGSRAT